MIKCSKLEVHLIISLASAERLWESDLEMWEIHLF